MASRVRIHKSLRKLTVPLATGAVLYAGEEVGVVVGTRTANVVSGTTNMKALGTAIEDVDQTAGDTDVEILLQMPLELEYFDNATDAGAVVLASHFLTAVYFSGGGGVTTAKTASAVNLAYAGVVYDVDAVDGVGVKRVGAELAELLS